MNRTIAAAVVVVSSLLSGTMARADDWTVAGSLAVTSDYRFRGISQNDLSVAPQGSLTVSGPDGWYAGAWASQLDFDDRRDTSIEVDVWFGKHFDLGDGLDLDVRPYYYAYPNHDSSAAGFHYSYFELITVLTKKFDKLTLAGTVAWSPDWFAESGTGWWLNASAAYQINDWLAVSGNFGRQSAEHFDDTNGIGFPYLVWDAGLTATWKQFVFDVRYVDTDMTENECGAFNGATNRHWCGATVVGTVTWNFILL
jgi:uncharacterized protein (TIGR02001 family)